MIIVAPATPGMQGFDTDTALDAAAAQALALSGFGFAVRYLSRTTPQNPGDLSADEVGTITNAGLALMAVQHVQRAGWAPSAAVGASYGMAASANATAVGLLGGTNLWLDLEGVASYATAADTIAYVNAWAGAVSAAGFLPGLYVGANQPLSGDDLYWRLRVKSYWRSASRVPDIPYRGYCMAQSLAPSPVPDGANGGIDIDRDVIMADAFGGVPMLLMPG